MKTRSAISPEILTSELISIPSLSGQEADALTFLEAAFDRLDWVYERIPVGPGNYNLFVTFGESPRVVFSTHVDVVPAPGQLFVADHREDRIIGRGACDAKGILASMIEACRLLEEQGRQDFGLLVLVEEESTGLGAHAAANSLQNRGIEYIVNGEPTECKLMKAHKGAIDFTILVTGRSCHSGYPELGVDANNRLLDLCSKLRDMDFGEDPVLGKATLNLGVIQAGVSANVISGHARLDGCVRTVGAHTEVLEKLRSILPENSQLNIGFNALPAHLKVLPGFKTDVAAYCTDIPGLSELGCEFLLIGPGSIHRAHTDEEWIGSAEIQEAIESYQRIAQMLLV